jgi:transcription elongation factor GreA
MAKNTLTQKKFDELSAKLQECKTTKRAEISKAIKTAKEFGDLSENAEYSAAKSEQEANEIEIARLEGILADVEIINESDINSKRVNIGTTVKVHDEKFDENVTFNVVSSLESSILDDKISDQSPIGRALIGHKKNDRVIAKTPSGEMAFTILEISKTGE